MAYGDGPYDEALRTAWGAFCDRLKAAGERVFKDVNPPTSLQRADGFRFLTQNLSQAFDLALETKDTRFPAIHAFCSPTRKLGSDNADCVYLQAWIDGSSVYRVTGRKGTARFWNMTIQGERKPGALHEPFGDTPQANLFGHELEANWDGSFEVYVGGERQGRNWLPTAPDTRKIYFRQYFDSWDEEAASYRIERVDMAGPRPTPNHETMIEAMRWASDFVYDVVDYWPEYLWNIRGLMSEDAFNRFDRKDIHAAGWTASDEAQDVRRGRILKGMRWRLAPDEAIIVEFDRTDDFWMLTNEGVFGNSMDYLYRPVSYTPSRTAIDSDGKIRLVMTHAEPGYANWIDTQAYGEGLLTFRNVMAREYPQLATRLVKVADLPASLPPDSKRMSKEERVAAMAQRLHAIQRRFRI